MPISACYHTQAQAIIKVNIVQKSEPAVGSVFSRLPYISSQSQTVQGVGIDRIAYYKYYYLPDISISSGVIFQR